MANTKDKEFEQEEVEVIEIFENGENYVFEKLSSIEYGESIYVILTPFIADESEVDSEDPAGVFIMRKIDSKNGEEMFEEISDTELVDKIFDIFKDDKKDKFELIDTDLDNPQKEMVEVIELFDENGENMLFELLAIIEKQESKYFVLIPFSTIGLNVLRSVSILQEIVKENGEKLLDTIQNQELVKDIFNQFKDENKDKFDFSRTELKLRRKDINVELDLNLDDVEAYNYWGNKCQENDNYHNALFFYEKAIELEPNNAEFRSKIGYIYQENGNYDKAIECYEKAIELEPNDIEILRNIGNAYYEIGNYDKAIEYYDKIVGIDPIGLNPADAITLNNLGNVYYAVGNYDEAIDCYHLSIDLDYMNGEDNDIDNDIGYAYQKTGSHNDIGTDIKLFLSSTFDEKMKEERDYFRNEINLELNQISGKIGKNLFLYDYELGISHDEVFSNVLDICFQKIDASDYFVGIIGNNYGTNINDKLKENYTGNYKKLINKGIQENLSVLELEFIESLRNKYQKKLFLIQKNISDNNTKVQNLIVRIKKATSDSNVKVIYYNEFQYIFFKIKEYFERKFKQEIDNFDFSQQKKNQFYAQKTQYYIHNNSVQQIHNELDNYIRNDSKKVFVLSDASGCGKTTALLKWVQQLKEDINYSTNDTKIISVCAGVEDFCKTPEEMLYYIYNKTLSNRGEDEKALLKQFPQFIKALSKKFKKSIVILDGINRLEFADNSIDKYKWLNNQLEDNVKVVISTIENIQYDCFEIHKMLPQNIYELIKTYLEKEGKEQIFEDFLTKINFKNGLPLFARMLCSEICTIAKYDTLGETIKKVLEKLSDEPDMVKLYKIFIERIQNRQSLNKNVVKDTFSFIYYSENGLNDSTLRELICNGDEDKESIVYTLLSLFSTEKDISSGVCEKMSFPNVYFRQAVKELYIDGNENKEIDYRKAILRYLEQYDDEMENDAELNKQVEEMFEDMNTKMPQSDTPMHLSERAYQIYYIKDKQRMYKLLSVKANASELHKKNPTKFAEYSALIEGMEKAGFWSSVLKKIRKNSNIL